MAVAAGIPTPEVVVAQGLGANAMTVGTSSRPTIAVGPELLGLLDRQQLQAVIAHEVAHVVNGDLFAATVLAAVYVRYELVAQWARISPRAEMPRSVYTSVDVVSVLAFMLRPALYLGWWVARLTGLAAARRREFLADRTAARLSRDPQSLIDALATVSEANRGRNGWADDIAHLCIVDPFDRESLHSRLAPHPLVSDRVDRLRSLESQMDSLR